MNDDYPTGSAGPNAGQPVLDDSDADWQFTYDCLREGHDAALLQQQTYPEDEGSRALLRASTAAIRAFREEHHRAVTSGLAEQLVGDGPE